MSAAKNNSDTPESDCSKTGKDTTAVDTLESRTSSSKSACFAAHQAIPGPVVPQNITDLKEEGTLEERLAKAKELNN